MILDYPAWMAINGYEKFYLFREGDECCSRYFPTVRLQPAAVNSVLYGNTWHYQPSNLVTYYDSLYKQVSNCPYENTQQTDYFWTSYEDNINNLDEMPIIYNHTYYPKIEARTCVNGTDFPQWMNSDKEYSRLYIFKNLEGL